MGVEEPEPCRLVTVLLTRGGGGALDPGAVVGVPLEEEDDDTTVEEGVERAEGDVEGDDNIAVEEGVEAAAEDEEEDEEGVTKGDAEELAVLDPTKPALFMEPPLSSSSRLKLSLGRGGMRTLP